MNKDIYNQYCELCTSCGHDGCCSYLSCIFTAIDNNKGCGYPESYKEELLLREEFFKACFEHEDTSTEIKEFVDNMYNIAYDKVISNEKNTYK